MKLLILSDVHGNRFGLEAVLEAANAYDKILCLGDIVDYGAHPNECCELLRDLGAICLSGNHDAAAVGLLDRQRFRPFAELANAWSAAQLTAENAHWLASLFPQYRDPNLKFEAVHASLREPWVEYIIGKSVALPTLERMSAPVCFYGHTHESDYYACLDVPGKRFQLNQIPLLHGGQVELQPEWKYLVNPGSCGQPRDRNPLARYALYDLDEQVIEIYEVEYDIEAAAAAIRASDMPDVFAERLYKGK